ncbi:MAG: 5-formyltetrahydrofolate cyclo-ligase [Sphingomonadaceae bacterium]
MVVPPLSSQRSGCAPMSDEKVSLRRELRRRRREFVVSHDMAALRVHSIVMARIVTGTADGFTSMACYFAQPFEVDAMPIIELCWARGIATALPCIEQIDGPMRFLRWQPGQKLSPGPYAIPQPTNRADEIDPDVIVMPLLGFDRTGNRLGQGGGFYDRALQAHPSARRVGLAWSVQEQDSIPVDSWDERLHEIVTERERIEF